VSPRGRSALLWGVVGLLSYAILAQAYLVFVGPLPLEPVSLVAVSVGIAVVVAGVAYGVEHRLAVKGRS
jgi:peptidoglycan/LPS O-acetylase OafA/YrhL